MTVVTLLHHDGVTYVTTRELGVDTDVETGMCILQDLFAANHHHHGPAEDWKGLLFVFLSDHDFLNEICSTRPSLLLKELTVS